jgi:HPt (histidine-containing phosphotransfer) domain-containing protein
MDTDVTTDIPGSRPADVPGRNCTEMRESHELIAVSSPPWSSAVTIQHFGGDEKLVRELIALFLESCPRLLEMCRARTRARDLAGLGRAAHALKGSLSNFTREAPTTTALELERLCSLGHIEAAVAMLYRLEQEVSRMVVDMKSFQNGAS